ncbi:MAG: thioredoxin family protein [Spirulinaceae cyanobacterium RM2_2_10]|nr:thioredoxin family protein [Spirulinaceae cyanobacterium SM2_1_0]NJO19119.1 thioredoxin family protein [Spirulinaceae cyanobacterium RM2_2_10]
MNLLQVIARWVRLPDWQRLNAIGLCLAIALLTWLSWPLAAQASLDDDRYDGNIFVVYAGNGSLVPPKSSLAESLRQQKPAILIYYVDDSRDCKQFALIVSSLQRGYGRAASFIPVAVDAIPPQPEYSDREPGHYYAGVVPQVVIFDQMGKVVLNRTGQVPYEELDDRLREVFDLLPRSETTALKRRSFNEFNAELN